MLIRLNPCRNHAAEHLQEDDEGHDQDTNANYDYDSAAAPIEGPPGAVACK